LYFSNNKNQFFSIDINTGSTNWIQKINSNLRPTLIDDYIFTVSLEGYLIIIEKNSGNIIRVTDIFKSYADRREVKDCKIRNLLVFKQYKCKGERVPSLYLPFSKNMKDSLIKPSGFIVGKENIYLTTNKGRLYIINIKTGQTDNVLKIDNGHISRPSVSNRNLYIIKDNSIIMLN
jgi:outer membrane protein assembly factor BamB